MNHQSTVLHYLSTVESATLREVYDNCGMSYYHNWAKHTGDVMSRLVSKGKVMRVKRGVFALGRDPQYNEETNPNQLRLI